MIYLVVCFLILAVLIQFSVISKAYTKNQELESTNERYKKLLTGELEPTCEEIGHKFVSKDLALRKIFLNIGSRGNVSYERLDSGGYAWDGLIVLGYRDIINSRDMSVTVPIVRIKCCSKCGEAFYAQEQEIDLLPRSNNLEHLCKDYNPNVYNHNINPTNNDVLINNS